MEVLDFTMNRVVPAIEKYRPDYIMADVNGVGAPGAEYLRMLGYKVIGVWAQGSPQDDKQYFNKRAECWGEMRLWLRNGAIDNSDVMKDDLKGPKRLRHKATGKLQVESKDDMKARGLASPNDGDALSVTFGQKMPRLDRNTARRGAPKVARDMDYDILGT
jgi:hypothetical protein